MSKGNKKIIDNIKGKMKRKKGNYLKNASIAYISEINQNNINKKKSYKALIKENLNLNKMLQDEKVNSKNYKDKFELKDSELTLSLKKNTILCDENITVFISMKVLNKFN